MKYGMNLLLWSGEMHEGLLPVLESLKTMGFDGVELPMFNLDVDKWASWAQRLDNLGLQRTAVTVRGADDNPISPDPAVRARGVQNNRRAWIAVRQSAPRPWSDPTTPPSACSAARARPAMNGSGASSACSRWLTRAAGRCDAGPGVSQSLRNLPAHVCGRYGAIRPAGQPSPLPHDV